METFLIMLCWVATNMACFLIGAKVVEKAKGEEEEDELPVAKPAEAVKEHREEKEAVTETDKQKKWLETVMQNVDNYDGTDQGQVDVPLWR